MLRVPAIALLLGLGASSTPAGFVELPGRPSRADFNCANYSRTAWTVSVSNGRLSVDPHRGTEVEDPLPFTYERSGDRAGSRRVVQVDDGWLVGFDAGEFGGGLWWFDRTGEHSLRVRPPSNAPANKEDVFRAENVQGFARLGGEVLVFMGLDHLGGRSGRIFSTTHASGWALRPFAVLDASPSAWVIDGQRLLVFTESGLWEALPENRTRRVHPLDDIGYLYANSMVQDADGAVYAGMRRYVLRLRPSPPGWRETWLVPSDCVQGQVVELECRCRP
jgi:hypothetical protein